MKRVNSVETNVKIEAKSFYLAAIIILVLMIVSGILTRVLPSGEFDRVIEEGRTLVVSGSYKEIDSPKYPIWRWFTAPFEVLFAPDNITPIVLIVFFIVPIAITLGWDSLTGLGMSLLPMAFNFGDGFSNVIFPTNALLLIALSFTVVSYTKWLRWTWKLQVVILVITSIFLAIAVKINYGPF
jgi:uncharacterized ion transporter superfamily protein YfcC